MNPDFFPPNFSEVRLCEFLNDFCCVSVQLSNFLDDLFSITVEIENKSYEYFFVSEELRNESEFFFMSKTDKIIPKIVLKHLMLLLINPEKRYPGI